MRTFLVATVVSLLVLFSMGTAWAQDPSSEPVPTPTVTHESPSSDGSTSGCDRVWGLGGSLCSAVSGAVGFGVGSVVGAGLNAVVHDAVGFVVEGANWLLGRVVELIDTSTRPDLGSAWFTARYRDMVVIAGLALLPFLLLAVIQSIIRQDAGMLFRASFITVPIAAVGTAGAVIVTDALLQVTDMLSAWVGRSMGTDLSGFAEGVRSALLGLDTMTVGSVAPLASLLGAAVIAFAAFVVWIELVLRQAAIYVAVLFLPLGFVALVWPATSDWLKRLVDALVAIILSKFVIVAVMALGSAALSADVASDGYGTVIGGGAMLSLAALAPYVLLRFIPVFNAGLSAQLEGAARRPTAAVAAPVPSGRRVVDAVRQRTHLGTEQERTRPTSAGGPPARVGGGSGAARGIAPTSGGTGHPRDNGSPDAAPTPRRPTGEQPYG